MNIFKKPAARFLAKRSALGLPAGFATIEIPQLWALNSAVECHLHTVEVTGSNPVAPTIFFKGLRGICPKSPTHNSTHKWPFIGPSRMVKNLKHFEKAWFP